MIWFVLYLLVGVFFAFVNTLALFHHVQGNWPNITEQDRRMDMGFATLFGLMSLVVWPLIAVVVFCLTGFYQYGVFKKRQ